MEWSQIPWGLRERAQWCLAAPAGMFSPKGKEPLSVRRDGSVYMASSTSPNTWLSFQDACKFAEIRGFHIGYMLHEDDPYACIDFDIKDAENAPDKPDTWTTREEMEVFYSYLRSFDTYTEHSLSGKGFHAWVIGKIGEGARNRGIEVYSQERFIITTGKVVNAKPVENRESMIMSFAEKIRPRRIAEDLVLTDESEDADDWFVLKTAVLADNGEKFWLLWCGEWESMGGIYPSQSEADLALMSMLTFYSKSNTQVKRMFRQSSLGQREKATKDDRYLNYTLRLIRSRERGEKRADISAVVQSAELRVKLDAEMVAAQVSKLQGSSGTLIETSPLQVAGQPVPVQQLPDTAAALARSAPVHPAIVHATAETGIQWPPGVAGRIAQFVYRSAPRPVKEVAIVASIGLLAGLCGKAWHIPQSGLNMYVVLIARSAIGKEAMNSGLSHIVREVTKINPPFASFVCFDDFASGPALSKYCASTSCFVNVSGEWGHKLKRMAKSEDGRDQAMTTLRQVMTNLYQKSGPGSIVGGIKYSDKDKNVHSINGVSYSMIGETTPGTFYEALTEDMMGDGFLSRFLSIEYTGERPQANPNQLLVPDSALVEVLSNIGTMANRVATFTAPSMPVGRDEESAKIMKAFEHECDREINKSKDESFRQMWNRAALKAMRLAALVAVADHHLYPVINAEHTNWAIDVVRRDIGIMQNRIEAGDVGISDSSRHRKMFAVLKHYLTAELPKTHKDAQAFKDNSVVTRKYLQTYCSQSTAFTKFRGGTVQALNLTLQALIDMGYIAEVEKPKLVKDYGFNGRAYRVMSLPDSTLGED